jgi:hypothetical protein
MTVLTKQQMMNSLNSECGVGQMESTGKFFFYVGFDVGGLFQWDCLNKPLAGITAE